MKTTALLSIHEGLGARIAEYAGWTLPIDYGSAVHEVTAVRTSAGLFDVSHMGRFDVSGHGSMGALQRVLANDLSVLDESGGQVSLICNESGGIEDDLIIFRESSRRWLLVVNAINREKDKSWIEARVPDGVIVTDHTLETSLLALQGPKSTKILQRAGFPDVAQLRRFHFVHGRLEDFGIMICRTGYTGEDGFEIACRNAHAEQLWNTLMTVGQDFGIAPCGLAARDILRMEAGYALYGHEIDQNTSPVEAGLMRFVKLTKGDFTGKDAITKVREEGPSRRLVGIEMEGRTVPRPGDEVTTSTGSGIVTSGTFSPTLGRGIAMTYLPPEVEDGNEAQILVHGAPRTGRIKRLPFYSRKKE